MKSHSALPQPGSDAAVAAISGTPAAPAVKTSLVAIPVAADSVRILIGIDVPVWALSEIEADWALVAATQCAAPDLAPEVAGNALARLHQRALQVTGVAVVGQIPNPFARWVRKAPENRAIAA